MAAAEARMKSGDRKRTPIPRRDLEHEAATGPSQVVEYILSPEELAEIRAKYPATPRDKKFKPPIEIKTKPKEGLNDMAKFKMSAEEYFAERATGKTLAQIAKEQGVSEVTVYNHMDKWTKEGKVPGPVEEPKPLREKDTEQHPATELQLPDMAEREIERLISEVAKLGTKLAAKEEAKEAVLRRLKAAEDSAANWSAGTSELQARVKQLESERDALASEIERLTGEVEHWKAQAAETVALSGQASAQLIAERDALASELERWKERTADARASRDAAEAELAELSESYELLLEDQTKWREREAALKGHIEGLEKIQAAQNLETFTVYTPEPTETQVLDSAIDQLTRARRIVKALMTTEVAG